MKCAKMAHCQTKSLGNRCWWVSPASSGETTGALLETGTHRVLYEIAVSHCITGTYAGLGRQFRVSFGAAGGYAE